MEDKRKVHPGAGQEGPNGEYRNSYTLSLISVSNVGEWWTPRPDRFTIAKHSR